MEFTIPSTLGYLKVIVIPTRFLMLMRFMPQVDMFSHLEVALFHESLARRLS
jgi:hypothetical protein